MIWGIYIKSSFTDPRCCDDDSGESPTVTTGWRALASSVVCVKDDGDVNTGYAHVNTLEQYNLATQLATGVTKPNLPSDSNYIADYLTDNCPIHVVTPPSRKYLTISNFVACKGWLYVTDSSGNDITRVITVTTNTTENIASGVYSVRLVSHATGSDTPVSCSLVINNNVFPTDGDITIVNQTAGLAIQIRPVGYQPPAI